MVNKNTIDDEDVIEDFTTYLYYDVLLKNGYEIVDVCKGVWCKDGDEIVYVLKDKDNIYYISKMHCNSKFCNSWGRMKEIYKEMERLNIGPKIYKFLDEEMICIMECGYETYDNYLKDETVTKNVKDIIDTLHENGYLHGDIHAHNIMVRKDKTPFLIDFENTSHIDIDDLSFIFKNYGINDIKECVQQEKENFDLVMV
jgi:serine/threonine protein kinase